MSKRRLVVSYFCEGESVWISNDLKEEELKKILSTIDGGEELEGYLEHNDPIKLEIKTQSLAEYAEATIRGLKFFECETTTEAIKHLLEESDDKELIAYLKMKFPKETEKAESSSWEELQEDI